MIFKYRILKQNEMFLVVLLIFVWLFERNAILLRHEKKFIVLLVIKVFIFLESYDVA